METMCPPGYHHSGFLAILVIMRRANCFHDCIYVWSSSCFCEIWALCVSWITYNHLYVYICIYIYIYIYYIYIYIYIYIYVIMETMCPPGYHHNGFVETHALGHMMYGSYAHLASVRFEHSVCHGSLMTTTYIYIYIYIFIYIIYI